MSTRSGKRLHNLFHDTLVKSDLEDAVKSEKKTKTKRLKENEKETASVFKSKKRNNYVSYPTDDEQGTDEVHHKEEALITRSLRKNALKDHNTIHVSETVESEDNKKSTRITRRTNKFPEVLVEPDTSKNDVAKVKKTKKKKSDSHEEDNNISMKTKKKKKGKKRSTSMVVEDIEPMEHNPVNKSNTSVESFHSAAGSPISSGVSKDPQTISNNNDDVLETQSDQPPVFEGRQTRSGKQPSNILQSDKKSKKRKFSDDTYKGSKRCKSSVNTNHDLVDGKSIDKMNNCLTSDENTSTKIIKDVDFNDTATKLNKTYEKDADMNVSKTSSRRSARKSKNNETYDKINNSITKADVAEKHSTVNTTHDKNNEGVISTKETNFDKDNTFEKDSDPFDKNQSIKSSTFNKDTTLEQDNEHFDNRKSLKETTFDKNVMFVRESNNTFDERQSIKNSTFNKETTYDEDSARLNDKKTSIKDSTFNKNETFDKDSNNTSDKKEPLQNTNFDDTFDKKMYTDNTTFDKDTVENSNIKITTNSTFDKKCTDSDTKDLTFDKDVTPVENQSKPTNDIDKPSLTTEQLKDTKLNTTFEKASKSSLISSDNSNITSDISRISITSDDSKENIVNMTPVLIESSMEESAITKTPQSPDSTTKSSIPITPLKREGTFTKDEPTISPEIVMKTPTKQMSMSSPGCTPFPSKVFHDKPLNLTRSIEKRRSSLMDALPRATKVMFCSPINNPAVVNQQRGKVIKSNLKGSNKSFVFEESCHEPRAGARRKRSYTQSDADDSVSTKRKRFGDDLQQSIDRLARPRTSSANAKLSGSTTPSKKATPSKSKISRTKLPNFAALHQKQFDKMESLDECQERKAKRAKQLLTPTGAITVLERISPKEAEQKAKESDTKPKPVDSKSKESETKPKKPETPIKSLPTLKSLNPGYSRFGFRLNLDVNPFISTKTDIKPKDKRPVLTRQATLPLTREPSLPSMTGATTSRREEAKRTVMREKSFTDKRNINRKENRTIIKGVRTNRRFELQMRMRNIE